MVAIRVVLVVLPPRQKKAMVGEGGPGGRDASATR